MKFSALAILSLFASTAQASSSSSSPKKSKKSSKGTVVRLKVVNLTYRQPLSPPVWVTHSCDEPNPLFTYGMEASEELAQVAETGSGMLLMEKFSKYYGCPVGSSVNGGLIMGGQMDYIDVEFNGKDCDCFSMASMLVNTNDAFVAINGMSRDALRNGEMSDYYYLPALDAGSEQNDESCDNIPGPACGGMGSNATGAEGFVHVHRGITGDGDLDPAVYSWLNPSVAVSTTYY